MMKEVVAALIRREDRFLICRRPAHKARGLLWEYPGGKVEEGETPEEALRRECREELDVELEVGAPVMDVTHVYPDLTIHLTLYESRIRGGEPRMLEHCDLRWITAGELELFDFCPADVEINEHLRRMGRKHMRAYERLIRYAKYNTTSHEENEGCTPSGEGEWNLARALAEEMKDMGMSGVFVDDNAYAYGFLPATAGLEGRRTLGLIAHLDTVDDCGGTDTHPRVIESYDGKPVALGDSGRVLDPAVFPHLKDCVGKTLVVTDGTSVLGADDKAGVAEIMTLCEKLIQERIPHGPISVCFTPDEEIGHGAALLDLEKFGAQLAFTVDGSAPGELEYETFNAASALLRFNGFSVHPGSAKGKMINAMLLAMEFNGLLPAEEVPARTEGRQGFYHLTEAKGSVTEAELHYILRDHDAALFEKRKRTVKEMAQRLNEKYGAGTVTCEIRDQYRNMAEVLEKHPEVVALAREAVRKAGLEPVSNPVRGGTDGSQLSFRGLPCPNLGTGGYAYHGYYEFAVAEEMDICVRILENLVQGLI